MTRKEIIDGLKFTVDMFLFDDVEGVMHTETRNELDKITVDSCKGAIELLEQQPCSDAISRQAAIDAFGLSEKTRKYGGDHSGYDTMMLYEIQDVIDGLPSVNPQASKEDIHREREQAYMKGYEDASKRYRTEPCEDVISRSDAIRVASGYCHWSNIPKELEKLPSVSVAKRSVQITGRSYGMNCMTG